MTFELDACELGLLAAAWLSVQNNRFDNAAAVRRLADKAAR